MLVTAVGSLLIRVSQQFEGGRKLGKTRQNVLIFVKGTAERAVAALDQFELTREFGPPHEAVLGVPKGRRAQGD